jgi:hypothetical protein
MEKHIVTATSNPQTPEEDKLVRRRWRIFLLIEFVVFALWFLALWAMLQWPTCSKVPAYIWSAIAGYLCFSLPLAALYLLGRPPVMIWPFCRSYQMRAYYRGLDGRTALTDDEFYARFYEGSGMPKEIPARIRQCLANLDILIERAYPSDLIWFADDELDYADVIYRVGRAFKIRFSKQEYPRFTGSLGNLIEKTYAKLREESLLPD